MTNVERAIPILLLLFFVASPAALAQDPEDLHPFVDSSDSVRDTDLSDGGLDATFVLSLPWNFSYDRTDILQALNDSLVGWMNTWYPMSSVPQGTIVNIKIIIRRGYFVAYAFSVQAEVTQGDTWEELLPSLTDNYLGSANDSSGDSTNSTGGGGGGSAEPSDTSGGDGLSGYYESNCWQFDTYVIKADGTIEWINSDISCTYTPMY